MKQPSNNIEKLPVPTRETVPEKKPMKKFLSFLLFLLVGAGIAISCIAANTNLPASNELLFGISFAIAGVSALLVLL